MGLLTILVVYSGLCGEAESEAIRQLVSLPVQRAADPVGVHPERLSAQAMQR